MSFNPLKIQQRLRTQKVLFRAIAQYMERFSAAPALLSAFLATSHLVYAETFLLTREGGVLLLPVQINHSITLNFTIDSGASDVVIPQDVFSTLSRSGTISSSDFLNSQTYELADGTRHETRRFRIRSLVIGALELNGVTGSIAPAGGALLLGQSFLSKLPVWSIDNRRGLLIVGDQKNAEDEKGLATPEKDQSESLTKYSKWSSCAQPFLTKSKAIKDFEKQLAILYPKFGLLWNDWEQFTSQCTKVIASSASGMDPGDSDASQCDKDAFTRAKSNFISNVAANAEPDAVREFNFAQTETRLALAEMEQTCGKP